MLHASSCFALWYMETNLSTASSVVVSSSSQKSLTNPAMRPSIWLWRFNSAICSGVYSVIGDVLSGFVGVSRHFCGLRIDDHIPR